MRDATVPQVSDSRFESHSPTTRVSSLLTLYWLRDVSLTIVCMDLVKYSDYFFIKIIMEACRRRKNFSRVVNYYNVT